MYALTLRVVRWPQRPWSKRRNHRDLERRSVFGHVWTSTIDGPSEAASHCKLAAAIIFVFTRWQQHGIQCCAVKTNKNISYETQQMMLNYSHKFISWIVLTRRVCKWYFWSNTKIMVILLFLSVADCNVQTSPVYTVNQKKNKKPNSCPTSPNINRFLKFFHCYTQ